MDLTLRRGAGLFLQEGQALTLDGGQTYAGTFDFSALPDAAAMLVNNTDAPDKVNGASFGGFVDVPARIYHLNAKITAGGAYQQVTVSCAISTSLAAGGEGNVNITFYSYVGSSVNHFESQIGYQITYTNGTRQNPVMFSSLPVNPYTVSANVTGHAGLGSITYLLEGGTLDSPIVVSTWLPVGDPMAPTRTQAVIYAVPGTSA